MLVRSDGKSLGVNYIEFSRRQGITATDQGLTLGVFTQVIQFKREDGLLAPLKTNAAT